jgi:ankyrin repeat protein
MKNENLDEYSRSPLHYVCIDNSEEDWSNITKKLIEDGYNINAQDKNGWTPLHFAAQEGSVEVSKFLIKSGANVHIKDDIGNTPLWVATMNSHKDDEVIKLLANSGSDPNEKNYHDVSPMDIEPELFKKT